jgi:CheY-like chemotaxis protein
MMRLQVLLVEDNSDDMLMFRRDFPSVFRELELEADLHAVETFEKALEMIDDPSRRFDLILSDTYRGEHRDLDAAVVEMVNKYRSGRFCPLVVFSASAKPAELTLGSFVVWADKSETQGIEKGIRRMLKTGIPQAARHLHDELDRLAGSYLWEFLEANWERLETGGHAEQSALTRLIRRRAALQLAELNFTEQGPKHVSEVSGLEIYMYPPLNTQHFSLGEVIRKNTDHSDIRVILTPHCYLTIQSNQTSPRAEYVITLKTVPVATVLGAKFENAKSLQGDDLHKKIRRWINPPSHEEVGKPEGRYWYLPNFLDIPHLYCDFLQVESIPYRQLEADYEELAVLSPPFAESLQACYGAFHGSVGVPNVLPASVASMMR